MNVFKSVPFYTIITSSARFLVKKVGVMINFKSMINY